MNNGLSGNVIHRCGDVVIKSTDNKSYIPRLKAQKNKQLLFANFIQEVGSDIFVPKVIADCETAGHYSYVMEYCSYLTYYEFIEKAGKKEIDRFVDILIAYLDLCIQKSEYIKISRSIFVDKILDIKSKIDVTERSRYSKSISYLVSGFSALDNLELPCGVHHGDLTFSNILFSKDGSRLCFMDLLDSFVDTVLFDIVKIRQDTKFFWSDFVNKKQTTSRSAITLSYIDRHISRYFSKYVWYESYYDIFEKLNLLRIAPYADKRVHKFLIGALNENQYHYPCGR